ncbi:unnamed protein product [Sphagnum tenellum]
MTNPWHTQPTGTEGGNSSTATALLNIMPTARELACKQTLSWLEDLRPDAAQNAVPLRPLFVGVCGPPGKEERALKGAEQRPDPAKKERGNELFKYRGNPGTHDVDLALRTLDSLADANLTAPRDADVTVRIPRYDKSLHGGRGDRLPFEQWDEVKSPFHVVLLEGWCVEFESVTDLQLEALLDAAAHDDNSHADCQPAISSLRSYPRHHVEKLNRSMLVYKPLWARLDTLIHLHTHSLDNVYEWRLEQERATREKYGSGMNDEEVRDFVDRFMPAHAIGLPPLLKQTRRAGRMMRIAISKERRVVDSSIS